MTRIASKKILQSARGEACTLRIPMHCVDGNETVVAAHLQFEGGKMGGKTDDHSIAYACYGCHTAIDQRLITPEERWYYMGRGLVRTWRKLIEKGVIKL